MSDDYNTLAMLQMLMGGGGGIGPSMSGPGLANIFGMIEPGSLTSNLNQYQDVVDIMADPIAQAISGDTGVWSRDAFQPNVTWEVVESPEYSQFQRYLNSLGGGDTFEGLIADELRNGGTASGAVNKMRQAVEADPEGQLAQIINMMAASTDPTMVPGQDTTINWGTIMSEAQRIEEMYVSIPPLGQQSAVVAPDGTVISPAGEIVETTGPNGEPVLMRRTEEASPLQEKFNELGLPSPFEEYQTEDFLPADWSGAGYEQAQMNLDAARQAMQQASQNLGNYMPAEPQREDVREAARRLATKPTVSYEDWLAGAGPERNLINAGGYSYEDWLAQTNGEAEGSTPGAIGAGATEATNLLPGWLLGEGRTDQQAPGGFDYQLWLDYARGGAPDGGGGGGGGTRPRLRPLEDQPPWWDETGPPQIGTQIPQGPPTGNDEEVARYQNYLQTRGNALAPTRNDPELAQALSYLRWLGDQDVQPPAPVTNEPTYSVQPVTAQGQPVPEEQQVPWLWWQTMGQTMPTGETPPPQPTTPPQSEQVPWPWWPTMGQTMPTSPPASENAPWWETAGPPQIGLTPTTAPQSEGAPWNPQPASGGGIQRETGGPNVLPTEAVTQGETTSDRMARMYLNNRAGVLQGAQNDPARAAALISQLLGYQAPTSPPQSELALIETGEQPSRRGQRTDEERRAQARRNAPRELQGERYEATTGLGGGGGVIGRRGVVDRRRRQFHQAFQAAQQEKQRAYGYDYGYAMGMARSLQEQGITPLQQAMASRLQGLSATGVPIY